MTKDPDVSIGLQLPCQTEMARSDTAKADDENTANQIQLSIGSGPSFD
ncbi:MAG: hypothetical protein JW384_02000 [Nitrosomonadaceae bacterium]|nr:hypothetical protein [Nitrosomonadaceae bacterium]